MAELTYEQLRHKTLAELRDMAKAASTKPFRATRR